MHIWKWALSFVLFLSVVLIFVVLIFIGCSVFDVAQELKAQPDVLDISITLDKSLVKCNVIMNQDAIINNASELARIYAHVVEKQFKDRDIDLTVIQDETACGFFQIKSNP